MKSSTHSRTQYWQLFIFLLILSITLIIGDNKHWWDNVREFIELHIVSRQVNHTENEKERMANLESKIISLENEKKLLSDENVDFRKQLEAPLPATLKFIPGYVISTEITKDNAVIRVAAGARDGVAKGMPVYSEAILIGIVASTTPRISTIELLSSPNITVAVKTSSGANGLIVGTEEKNRPVATTIDRVLQTETLQAGDEVTTSGEDELPPNTLVGEVSIILSEAREPFQKAQVSLYVNPENLKRVFIAAEN